MIRNQRYYWWWLLPFCLLVFSCTNKKEKRLNRRMSFWRKDKIPYGTYVAFENLSYLFPDAGIITNDKAPDENRVLNPNTYNNSFSSGSAKKLYVIISQNVFADQSEINAMWNFIGEGNHVFIAADHFGDSLLSSLGLANARNMGLFLQTDSMTVSIHNPLTWDSSAYVYPGIDMEGHATKIDSVYATVLGRDAVGRPNFLRYTYKSGGSVYIHFTPVAFTNFFLLHKNNKEYYDQVFSYLPKSIRLVIWDDYFRTREETHFSAFQFILNNPSLRWAFWILLLLFGMIYIFESKRKQRMIPSMEPMNNSSLDFVKTIGRLYFQRRDNGNLAVKMSNHFLDHVRTQYNIPTGDTDIIVAEKLAYKTGMNKEDLFSLIGRVKYYLQEPHVTDEELMDFNKDIQAFYKQA